MKKLLLFIMIQQVTLSVAQEKTDCEKILAQEINFEYGDERDLDSLNTTLLQLVDCDLGIEQIDVEAFLTGSMTGVMIVGLVNENKAVTYQNLIDKFLAFKNEPGYYEYIDLFKRSNEFSTKVVDLSNWEADKLFLVQLDLPPLLIDGFYEYLKTNSASNKTYGDYYNDYTEILIQEEDKPSKISDKSEYLFESSGNVNYEDVFQESLDQDKPLLLYFTGWAIVNGRKIEALIMEHPEVVERLETEFHLICLFVDEKESLPKGEQLNSATNGKQLKYVGEKHSELQMTKFQTNTQPYFVIIDKNGKKIAEHAYTNEIESFEAFLNTVKKD